MYGPALPTDLSEEKEQHLRQNSGPGQKRKCNVGPELPPELKKLKEQDGGIGPDLPPSSSKLSIGPALPPEFAQFSLRVDSLGPALPPGFALPPAQTKSSSDSDSDASDVIGPVPEGMQTDAFTIAQKMHSMRRMKGAEKQEDGSLQRESWMTEIPDRLGGELGMPVARTRLGDGRAKSDKSGWTETPQDKEKRLQGLLPDEAPVDLQKEDFAAKITSARDQEMAQAVQEYNKKAKRDETLFDLHQKKIKKKKEKKEKKEKKHKKDKKHKKGKTRDDSPPANARRPFDRNTDLRANVLDDAQKAAYIKRTQKLSTRFEYGAQRFL